MGRLRRAAWSAAGRLAERVVRTPASGPRLSLLIYHGVSAEPEPLGHADVDAATFSMHLEVLASAFEVLPLGEAARRLRDGSLPARAASITFDDGYADNATVALPLLQRHGLKATFFVATGYLDGGRMFNDVIVEALRECRRDRLDLEPLGLPPVKLSCTAERAAAIRALLTAVKHLPPGERRERAEGVARAAGVRPRRALMMSTDQVRRLAQAGMELGCHTHTHPMLTSVSDEAAARDIDEGKRAIEAIAGGPVTVFAYPNGRPGRDYRARHVDMVREAGFHAAVSTARGVAHKGSDPFQLPRFTPWDATPERFLARLALSRRELRCELAS